MTDFLKASKESNRDLAIEAKLDKLANAAIKSTHKEKMIKYKPKVNQPIVQSSSYTSELDKRDYVLDAKADKIALANIPDPLGFRQTQSFKSPVTEEMIAEAQAESQKIVPIVINGRNYKFNPSSLPPPDLEPLPVLRNIGSDADITNAVRDKQQSVAQIQRLNEEIKQLNNDEIFLDNEYNENHPNFQTLEARLQTMTRTEIASEFRIVSGANKNKSKQVIIKYILDHNKGNPDEYHKNKAAIESHRQKLFSELADNESNIGEIDRFIEQEAIIRKENDAAVRAVEKVNREKLATYAQDLEAMNRGKLTVEQMPNESLEDYRQRLIDTGNTPLTDEEIKDSANLTNTLKAKQNLSQLINNKGKVETAVKMLSDDERYLLNKEFSRIKKIFIDNYGTNNKDVTEQDIVDLVHDVLNTPLVKSNMNTALVPATAQPPIIIRAAPVDYSSLNAMDGLKRFAEVNGVPLAGVRTIPAIVKQIENIIRGRTGGMPNELPIELIHKIPKGTREKLRDEGYLQNYGGGGGGGSSAEATGSGLKSGIPEYPKFIKFGKVMISPDKLYFKNMLLIRNPHGHALTGIPNTKVSDVMVSILMKCLEGQKISKSELNLLSQHERHLYDNLMWMSGGHKIHEHTIMESAKEMKHRLSLIEGELDAGNNSELIKKELHHLLHRMARSGLISVSNAASYYKEMKMHYFPQNKK